MHEVIDSFMNGRPVLNPPHVWDMMVVKDIIHIPRSAIS